MKFKIALIFISISLCSVHYHDVKRSVMYGPHLEFKSTSYLDMQKGIEYRNQHQKYFWAGRIVSEYAASMWCYLSGSHANKFYSAQKNYNEKRCAETQMAYLQQIDRLSNSIAGYSAAVLFISFLIIIFYSKRPLLFVFGMSAALQYAWLPMAEQQVNPWDQLALLSWIIILMLESSKYKKHIVWVIPLLSLLKETTAVLSILILFWDDVALKDRIRMFALSLGLSVVAKCVTSYMGGSRSALTNQSWQYDYNPKLGRNGCRTGERWIFERNLNSLGWWSNFNHVAFSVAGTWVATLLLPIKKSYKALTISYLLSIFIILPGNITEARLWQELIPVFFVGFENIKGRAQ